MWKICIFAGEKSDRDRKKSLKYFKSYDSKT